MKQKVIKKEIYALSILVSFSFLIYSCWEDEWHINQSNEVVWHKNKELTISEAEKWYDANNPIEVSMRSHSFQEKIPVKPNWNKATESRQGRFEVVETVLMTNQQTLFMDNETKEKQDKDPNIIRNVARLVVIKNTETGDVCNFIMVFVGSYNYLKKTKTFEQNSYLHRESDFDGSVYFYELDNRLVNGWRYKDGEIIAAISPGTKEGYLISRGASNCWDEVNWIEGRNCWNETYWDYEFGQPWVAANCEKTYSGEYTEVCVDLEEGSQGGGEWNSGGGPGGFGSTPTQDPVKNNMAKLVNEKLRTNCGFAGVLDNIGGLDKLGSVSTAPLTNSTAGYNPNDKIMHLPDWDYNVTSSTFLEEFVHFMQDQVYPNGTANLAVTNIEFEAKLIVDLYRFGKDGFMPSGGSQVLQRIDQDKISKNQYESFLKSIQDGTMTNETYREMLNKFNDYTPYPEYQNRIDNNLSPALLNSYGKLFLLNNCK